MTGHFERELTIMVIVIYIRLIVHYQKLPERHIRNLLFVLSIMFEQHRQSQRFVQLCVGVDVESKE